MRRWVIILLLIIYPFQAALALADACCVTTSDGPVHQGMSAEPASALAGLPAFVVDEAVSALSDLHCPSCNFGHQLYLPSFPVAIPIGPQRVASRMAGDLPFPASPPPGRLERPKWPAAAG